VNWFDKELPAAMPAVGDGVTDNRQAHGKEPDSAATSLLAELTVLSSLIDVITCILSSC
jgi:hypothetical protein